jgi:exodeoxyribonuclease III
VSSAYAGPALLNVAEGFSGFKDGYADEGRVLTLEFDSFFLVFAYVPNSGMKLERLAYRVNKWDEDFRAYLAFLDNKKPVVLGGDLNVGHLDADIYNKDAPHVKKSAGLTPEERLSFSKTLEEVNLRDTFRAFHPNATGWFTYWSGRVGNRPKNRGLRLDYFLASARAFACEGSGSGSGSPVNVEVLDGYILDRLTVGASDHAPLGVTLALRR